MLDKAVSKSFPEARQLHPKSPLRRGRGEENDYESQVALLIAHKCTQKTNVTNVAQALVDELQKDLPEFVEKVVLTNNNVLNFKVRYVS